MTAKWQVWDRLLRKLARLNVRYPVYTPRIKSHCFIIGAMKSGTTSLYNHLIQHPQVAPNRFQKEPEFFSQKTPPDDLSSYGRQWLATPFAPQIALEASTGYSKYPAFPNVAERLKALPGRKYFIYILRDPVARIESQLAHNARRGNMPDLAGPLEEVLAHYLATSRYASQLDLYRAAFPDLPVKIVLMQTFMSDPSSVLRDICSYLEIDPDYAFELLPPQNTRPATQAATILSDEHRRHLYDLLHSDMCRLREAYGVDVSAWTRDGAASAHRLSGTT